MKTKILIILLGMILMSCSTQASDEKKIKQTVINFLDYVEKDNKKECEKLIYDSKGYYGSIYMQLSFFHKNYDRINSITNLKKNIKVKDTVYILGEKFKYVQYRIKNNNPNGNLKPLIITFIFYKQVGYNKIYSHSIIDNMVDWRKGQLIKQ